jgi:hypothetical protein
MSEPSCDGDSEGHAADGLEQFNGESELERFSRVLREAQEKAQETERLKGKKRKAHTGHSHMTAYRRKRVRITLAKKGFLPVNEFLRQKKGRDDGVALTAVPQVVYEEAEESSESSDDGGQNLDSDTAADNAESSMDSPDMLCLDTLREEEEESTASENGAESDSHMGPQQDDPNLYERDQTIIAQPPSSAPEMPHSPADGTMDILRDLPRLEKARKELTLKVNDRMLDLVFRVRVQAMVGLLNLFLDPGIKYTWREASQIVSKAQGHSKSRAQHIRAWVLMFVRSRTLPLHRLGQT